MNEIIQNLEANETNGKENFCSISEKKLLAIKELSKREFNENAKLKQALNEIRKYINTTKISKDGVFLVKESTWGQDILQIIDKVLGDDE